MESARFEMMKEMGLFDPADILSCNYIWSTLNAITEKYRDMTTSS